MTKKLSNATASIIQKCYSLAALGTIALELGTPLSPGKNIFQSLVAAGKAIDFDQAVEIVAAYLESHDEEPTDPIN